MHRPVNDFIEMEARFGANNYKPLDVVLTRGEGVYVWDTKATAISIASPPIRRSTRATAIPKILRGDGRAGGA